MKLSRRNFTKGAIAGLAGLFTGALSVTAISDAAAKVTPDPASLGGLASSGPIVPSVHKLGYGPKDIWPGQYVYNDAAKRLSEGMLADIKTRCGPIYRDTAIDPAATPGPYSSNPLIASYEKAWNTGAARQREIERDMRSNPKLVDAIKNNTPTWWNYSKKIVTDENNMANFKAYQLWDTPSIVDQSSLLRTANA